MHTELLEQRIIFAARPAAGVVGVCFENLSNKRGWEAPEGETESISWLWWRFCHFLAVVIASLAR
jgi:hypothetical protein